MIVSWTARRTNQSILKEISPECSLEGLLFIGKAREFKKKKIYFCFSDYTFVITQSDYTNYTK